MDLIDQSYRQGTCIRTTALTTYRNRLHDDRRQHCSSVDVLRGSIAMELRGVILDVDGTLVDSNDAHAKSWSIAAGEFGFVRPVEFFQPLIGMGSDRVLPKVDGSLNHQEAPGTGIIARRAEIFREQFLPQIEPTPGAHDLVKRLTFERLRCIVATSAGDADVDDLLNVVKISSDIFVRATSDDAEYSKPAGDIVAAALRKGRLKSSEAIMIGDTPFDVDAGSRVGVPVIALRCGGWNDDRLLGAIEIYDDPRDLLSRFDVSALSR